MPNFKNSECFSIYSQRLKLWGPSCLAHCLDPHPYCASPSGSQTGGLHTWPSWGPGAAQGSWPYAHHLVAQQLWKPPKREARGSCRERGELAFMVAIFSSPSHFGHLPLVIIFPFSQSKRAPTGYFGILIPIAVVKIPPTPSDSKPLTGYHWMWRGTQQHFGVWSLHYSHLTRIKNIGPLIKTKNSALVPTRILLWQEGDIHHEGNCAHCLVDVIYNDPCNEASWLPLMSFISLGGGGGIKKRGWLKSDYDHGILVPSWISSPMSVGPKIPKCLRSSETFEKEQPHKSEKQEKNMNRFEYLKDYSGSYRKRAVEQRRQLEGTRGQGPTAPRWATLWTWGWSWVTKQSKPSRLRKSSFPPPQLLKRV